jgi:hypothetical protein
LTVGGAFLTVGVDEEGAGEKKQRNVKLYFVHLLM